MDAPATTTTTAIDTARKPQPKNQGGVKETIESILVAFILAFVFRAFVVEAFVIPTGSMATTLLGAHTRFHCPDCGYNFDVNFSGSTPEEEENPPSSAGQITDPIYCPNCGFMMPAEQLNNPPVFYGDRILVLKYIYLLQQPSRWDVVVFKAPIAMTTNYIKRLIGKPHESIMVLDGDVYVKSAGESNYVIQTKPKGAQDAVWRLVYDNDFHPQAELDRGSVHPWQQPWTVVDGNGWNLSEPATHGRIFSFNSDTGSSRLRFDPVANPTAQTLSDYMVYDQQSRHMVPTRSVESRYPSSVDTYAGEIPVTDVDLHLTYQRKTGNGPLRLELTKRNHQFVAEITPTQAILYHDVDGTRTQVGSTFAMPASSHPMRIEFSNADYQVTLRIDDQVVAQTTPADFSPNIPMLVREFEDRRTPPPGHVDILAEAQQCTVSHLSLWRDQYYYNERYGVVRATPSNPVVLGDDEYFVMGDNSILSYDARCWPTGVNLPDEDLMTDAGKVPGRFLLGKAFYVYWPAGYQVNSSMPALVPNFGKMRFIH